jgi:hypothetical protein
VVVIQINQVLACIVGTNKLNQRKIPRRPNNGQSAQSFRCLKR